MNLGEPVVPVSLNLSRLDFELCDIYDAVDGYRKLYDIPKRMLDIEITESALTADADSLKKHIIGAANEMGVQTLHEGVETMTHFDFLRSVGCGRAQGYYFGKPMPLEESRSMTRSKGLVWEKQPG